MKDESKLEILRKVEDGTLTPEEGFQLIGIFDAAGAEESEREFIRPPLEPEAPGSAQKTLRVSGGWKAAWSTILLRGAVLTAFSAYWIFLGYQKAGLGWSFWLSWIPFAIGVLMMALDWILMTSPWLQARIRTHEKAGPKNINLNIPLPLSLVSWAFSNFGQCMPDAVKEKSVEEMLLEIEQSLKQNEPFQVEVDDQQGGDHVFICITR
jgi:hypothetical protein